MILICVPAFANNYYVNSASTSSISNGSFLNPWKTIAQVNSGTTLLNPGDTVFFKRGQTYVGNVLVNRSGVSGNPIVYTAYGTGDYPIMTNTVTDVISIYNKQYIVLDGFKIIDNTMSTTNHGITAKISYAINIENSPYCTVRNCDISLVGVAISVTNGSNYTTIDNNYIHNLRIVRNTVGGDDDYGANATVIGSSRNRITNNKFEACWAYCYDYGHDGGAIEFFGFDMSYNTIMYNTSIECDGFMEVGSNVDGTSINNTIAYNKIINNGPIGVFHNNSNFTVNVYNVNFYNNTIIENKKLFDNTLSLFWYATNVTMDVVYLYNNIIWLTSGIYVANSNTPLSKMVHANNIYKFANGTNAGVQFDPTELIITDSNTIFKDTTPIDPINWDLHLAAGSPAIDFGLILGYTKDFEGNSIIGNPDAGVYENQEVASPPTHIIVASATATPINCYGDTSEVTVSVTGGIAPYTGIGNFKVLAGTYSYIVKDFDGHSDTVTIKISQPGPLSLSLSAGVITTIDGTTTLTGATTGGSEPYQFQLNNGLYQLSNIFYNLPIGLYQVVVKDDHLCLDTASIVIPLVTTTTNVNKKLQIYVYPNPTATYFTLNPIKVHGRTYPIKIRVYNTAAQLVYYTEGNSGSRYYFGSDFLPSIYTLIVEVANTVQAVQLVKI